MNARDTGPPEKGKPRSGQVAGDFQKQHLPVRSYCYADGLRRRRAAADDMRPLPSGRRDPWWYPPPGARGYEQAALHLLEHGLMPAANLAGLKAMSDRHAAEQIAQAWRVAA
jgi:hypothetical protein